MVPKIYTIQEIRTPLAEVWYSPQEVLALIVMRTILMPYFAGLFCM